MTGSLFKCFLLAGLLTSCENDQAVAPTGTDGITVNERNAKASLLLRLTKVDNNNIQYVKSGKFFGRIARINSTFNGVDQ